MEDKNPLKDYVWNTGNAFEIMRLLVEGAVTLFDDEASPLFRLGRQYGQEKAAAAFDAIGTALFELRMKNEITYFLIRQNSNLSSIAKDRLLLTCSI